MKKLMLLLCVALLLVPAATAEGGRLLKLDDSDYIGSLFTDGETLYVTGDNRLYTWKPGEEELTAWESDLRLPEEDRALNIYELTLFAADGGLKGLRTMDDGDGALSSFCLFDVAFTDRGAIEAENPRVIAVPSELRSLASFYVQKAGQSGDVLYVLGEQETGCQLCAIDLNDPARAGVASLSGWDYGLLVTPDGALLADSDYMQERVALSRVGLDGSLEELCELPLGVRGLAADPVTGAVFAALDGRAYPADLSTGELGDAVAILPMDPNHGAALDGGRLYALDVGANILLVDAGAVLASDEALNICGYSSGQWLQDAFIDYSLAHPELQPSMRTEYKTRDELLNDMLTQSSEVDIYMLDCRSSGAYQALKERGYMLPLDGSEALSALAERMYPALREGCSRDGALVALPVQLYGFCTGIDASLLAKMGLSASDVPGDWLGFLSFLEDELLPRMDALGEKDRFTYDGVTAESFRYFLLESILENYVYAAAAAGEIPDYENPDLVAILEKLDGMDFTIFGLEETDEDNGYGYGWSSDQAYLIQPDVSVELAGGSVGSTSLILDYGDSLKGVLALNTEVFFINPYSRHADEALAFLETVAERLPNQLEYMLCPDLNEPVRRSDADRELKWLEQQIGSLKEQIEAAEPIDRQRLEEELAMWEEEYASFLENGVWEISANRLAWYRDNADRAVVVTPSWFDEDTSGEAWELLEQYREGQLSARDFLAAVNRKARMMAMEG